MVLSATSNNISVISYPEKTTDLPQVKQWKLNIKKPFFLFIFYSLLPLLGLDGMIILHFTRRLQL